VIYSSWYTDGTFSPTWGDTTLTFVGVVTRAIKAAPGITASIIDQGLVLAYIKGTPVVEPQLLPWTLSGANIGYPGRTFQLNYIPQPGKLFYYFNDIITGGAAGFGGTGGFEFRYILIPGGVAGGRFTSGPAAGYSIQQIKSMSYQQVTSIFNIPSSGSNVR
jgi:hypothetical protein